MADKIRYVSTDTTKMTDEDGKLIINLLWGDSVKVISEKDGWLYVKARGRNGYVNADDIGDNPVLEVYFIDVGQGDGVLIVTPERKHILIDGGYTRTKQPHGKSAADFVDWKFKKDYGKDTIHLDAMISSHNDADHYGGLWDLLNKTPVAQKELNCDNVVVDKFYHAGVSWWETSTVVNGKTKKARTIGAEGEHIWRLIDTETSIKKGLNGTLYNGYKLQGEWAEFMKCIVADNIPAKRLAYKPGKDFKYVDGFGENDTVQLKVLGPIEFKAGQKPALSNLKSDSQNTNGNSLLLRLDYGSVRILLTGDLNKKSQNIIYEAYEGQRQELSADVIKGCHHGSDDCSFRFLETVHAAATVISSGDDESHAHPRPNIVAASGISGYKTIDKDDLITPLVYSTEIARSVRLGTPVKLVCKCGGETVETDIDDDTEDIKIHYTHTPSGALKPILKSKTLNSRMKVVDGFVYGLVNVRTDGKNILMATLNENGDKWDIKKFKSRF